MATTTNNVTTPAAATAAAAPRILPNLQAAPQPPQVAASSPAAAPASPHAAKAAKLLAKRGKAAPAPTAAPSKAAKGKATAAANPANVPGAVIQNPTLYLVGHWPLNQQPNSYRRFAYNVAMALQKAQPKGFTQQQFRAALVASQQVSTTTPPTGGWARHNMPTWAAGQQWLLPAAAVQAAKAKAAQKAQLAKATAQALGKAPVGPTPAKA